MLSNLAFSRSTCCAFSFRNQYSMRKKSGMHNLTDWNNLSVKVYALFHSTGKWILYYIIGNIHINRYLYIQRYLLSIYYVLQEHFIFGGSVILLRDISFLSVAYPSLKHYATWFKSIAYYVTFICTLELLSLPATSHYHLTTKKLRLLISPTSLFLR